MIKKIIFILSIAIMLFQGTVFADSKEVSVSLLTFDIQLNNVKINNTYSQYPFIIYNGITYFPMTFYHCYFLGLETKWSEENGLSINNIGSISEYKGYETTNKNSRTYHASIPSFDITINGKLIDNSKEKYPLLLFRNVTYFPLTWHFIVDEFNWKYDFDQTKGLSINTRNLSVQQLKLPFEEKHLDKIEILDGYYYYSVMNNDENNIYRTPINDLSKTLKIHKIEKDLHYKYVPTVSFSKMDGELFLTHYVGGASMGNDVYYHVDKNGTAKRILSSISRSLFFRKNEKGYFVMKYFLSGICYIKSGQNDLTLLGNQSYIYGRSEGKMWYVFTKNMDVVDDWVYTTCFEVENESDKNKLYKINIDTNEMVLISDIPVDEFSISNDKIYFISNSQDGKLHTMTLDGEQEKVLINTAIDVKNYVHERKYVVDEDIIYYVSKEDKELFKLNNNGTTLALLPNKKVSEIKLINKNLICILEDNEDYGLVIFDKDSNQIFKTSDKVSYTAEEGSLLIYKVYESGNFYTIQLP